ncbi:hypothetical protein ACFL7D_00435 [candidate division KSB1 bacterium]
MKIKTGLLLVCFLVLIVANVSGQGIEKELNITTMKISNELKSINNEITRINAEEGQEEAVEKIDITIDAQSGMNITVDHKFGDIKVVKGTNDKITIKGEKRVTSDNKTSAEAFLKKVSLEVDENPGRVKVISKFPEKIDSEKENIESFSLNFTMEVPENVQIQVSNSFGGTDVVGLSGEIHVDSKMGAVNAVSLKGDIYLSSSFGSLTAENLDGSVNASAQNGSLDISNVNGDLNANSRFGDIKIFDVKGKAEIIGGNGEIYVEKIRQITSVTGQFGPITVKDIEDRLSVENKNGNVEVFNVKGYVNVQNSFGAVVVDGAANDVNVNTRNGNVNLSNVFFGKSDVMRTIVVNNTFGRIEIELPSDLSAKIKAFSNFGDIKNDFGLEVETASFTKKNLDGKVGGGKDAVWLEGNNTTIVIKKK